MRALWNSKKFKTSGLAGIVAVVASYGGWTNEQVLVVLSPLLAYIGAQGLAAMSRRK